MLRKYGTATHIRIPVVKAASANFAVSADWTPAAGDVKISKDGGGAANVTNLPTAITMGNAAMWDFSLTATEMQAAEVVIIVADSATKAVEDQAIVIETYGHASAEHAFDLDTATQSVTVGTGGIAAASFAAGAIDAAAIAADAIGASELAADAVTEIAAAITVPTAAAVADAVWDEATTGHTTSGTFGEQLKNDVDAILVDTAEIGTAGAGLTALATQASVNTIDDLLDTEVAAIKADTAAILADTGTDGVVVASIANGAITAAAIATGAIDADAVAADAVTEIQSGLATSASVTGAQADLDDIQTRLPAALVSGRIDASVGAMAANTVTASAVATDAVTEIQSGLATLAALSAVDADVAAILGTVDTEVASILTAADAIKAKTDLLPAAPAATGDIPTAAAIADAVLDEAIPEPAGVPAWPSSIRSVLGWIGAWSRNKTTQTSTTTTLRNDADSATIATMAVADDGTTFESGEAT